ncbi:spermidine/putrescine ABC transporter substrate-binding protein [Ventosimonas gracilis]|uniref:Putrescine-binding periplasmic protein n=1 Tax=Ventosimonas gracilis TaxID=1680762 RepID=A0A139SMH4_9GAMM|nr:extracellular solute-binding protein [Ventosimonas gracilis]KXU35732.1 spermidine/putrescine ABC transporter substrate-binding protein [Ventosimonas gracilis]
MKKPFKTTLAAFAASFLFSSSALAAGQVNIFSWSGTFAPEALKKFEAETGIKPTIDAYDSNETLLAKLKQGGSGYDVISPTHEFLPILISEGLITPFNPAGEAYYDNLVDNLKKPAWDPDGLYSMPYYWGTTSFGFDTAVYNETVDSYSTLFNPPKALQGKINMFDSPSEIMSLASLYLGLPFCAEDSKQAQQILNLLKAQKPFVKTYSSKAGSIRENLIAGELSMSTVWGGSFLRARESRASLKYVYPKEGVLAWVEGLAIPKDSRNPENAKKLIAFLSQPENSAMTQAFLKHQSPIKGTDPYLDPALQGAPELYIPDDAKLVFSQTCGEAAIRLADRVWTNLMR